MADMQRHWRTMLAMLGTWGAPISFFFCMVDLAMLLAIPGLFWGSKPPLPISLMTHAVLSVAGRVIFTLEGVCIRAGGPEFGGEVLKLLPCLFLRMRVSRPATTLPGVLDTSSTP